MSRLPEPGSDDDVWGTILNDFLEIAHNQDGTLQASAVKQAGAITNINGVTGNDGVVSLSAANIGAYAKPSGGIPNSDLDTSVQTSLSYAANAVQLAGDLGGTVTTPTIVALQGTNLDVTTPANGQVISYNATNNQWVPSTVDTGSISDATASNKGILQLDGDLSGTAALPTVVNTHLSSPLPTSQGGLGATGLTGVLMGNGSSPVTGSAPLNNLGAPTADFSMNGYTLTNLSDPVNTQDTATKHYVDSVAQGLDPKQSVTAATATTLPSNTYSNGSSGVGATLTATAHGALVVDGYSVNTNDRILVQNEASSVNNGIYAVTAPGSTGTSYILTRSSDFDLPSQVVGAYVFSNNGTTNGNASFLCVTTGTVTFGTTAITWNLFSKISGLGTAASLNAGVANGVATLNGTSQIPSSQLPTLSFSYSQTWTVAGYVNVAQGDVDYINPIFVSSPSPQILQLVSCQYVIHNDSSSSATVGVYQNGVLLSSFSNIVVTTTKGTTTPGTPVTLSNGDMLQLVVASVNNTPLNMSFSIVLQVSI